MGPYRADRKIEVWSVAWLPVAGSLGGGEVAGRGATSGDRLAMLRGDTQASASLGQEGTADAHPEPPSPCSAGRAARRGHLEQILPTYLRHYNEHRPHRALGLLPPDQPAGLTVVGEDQQGRMHQHVCAPFTQVLVEDWRIEYNTVRPHSALGYLTPTEGWTTTQPTFS
jgi:Integrase core domain